MHIYETKLNFVIIILTHKELNVFLQNTHLLAFT